MYHVTRSTWDNIPEDYKGTWQDYHNEHPEWMCNKRSQQEGISDG